MSGWKKVALLAVALACLPQLSRYVFRKGYKVHEHGAIVISGASTGIGRHAAFHLAEQGYHVYAGVRKAADETSILNEAKERDLPVFPIFLDVTKEESVQAALKAMQTRLAESGQALVGLVNNAAITKSRVPIEFANLEEVKGLFNVNLFGMYRLTQAFLPALRASKGRIVNIGSMAGRVAISGMGTYASSKFALEAFTDSLRRELNVLGVSVSVVEPAYIKTPILTKSNSQTSFTLESLPADQKELYLHVFEKKEEDNEQIQRTADSPIVSSEAIAHALLNPFPRTRYVVANAKGVPAWLLDWVIWFLPDRAVDSMLIAM